MFNGLFQYNKVFAVFAVSGIILSSIYMLRMIQYVFYGTPNELGIKMTPISGLQKIVLAVMILFVIGLGIYPEPVFNLTQNIVTDILARAKGI
jgi:NADH-quinone oxidoreductase subunit M